MIFSSKLSSLDQPSPSPFLSVSASASAKSITRGVVGGGLFVTFETSDKGVVGRALESVDIDLTFDGVFEGGFGDRGISVRFCFCGCDLCARRMSTNSAQLGPIRFWDRDHNNVRSTKADTHSCAYNAITPFQDGPFKTCRFAFPFSSDNYGTRCESRQRIPMTALHVSPAKKVSQR